MISSLELLSRYTKVTHTPLAPHTFRCSLSRLPPRSRHCRSLGTPRSDFYLTPALVTRKSHKLGCAVYHSPSKIIASSDPADRVSGSASGTGAAAKAARALPASALARSGAFLLRRLLRRPPC